MGAVLKKGVNDLLTVMPNLAKEWHPVKNGKLTPADVCVKSSRKVWWLLTVERYGKVYKLEWEALVSNRANGSGCPYTSKPPRKLLKGFNDLVTTNPKIAALWHPEKNEDMSPDMIFGSTNDKYWWCHEVQAYGKSVLHEWKARPNEVTENSCPFCTGAKVKQGVNDLKTTHPDIAKQWDNLNNDFKNIHNVSAGSNKRANWICNACGHKWNAIINNRTRGSGCPDCARRYQTSFSEQTIYYYLKTAFPTCVNRDITKLEGLELDILLPNEKIAIEYNGLRFHSSKEKQKRNDLKHQLCKEKGILLITVIEHEFLIQHDILKHIIYCKEKSDYSHMNYVMKCINDELKGYLREPIKVDIPLHRQSIYAQYWKSVEERSLAIKFPELLDEWDYEKNKLNPYMVFAHSNVVVYWKHIVIKNNKESVHSWQSSVSRRTTQGHGCSICAGKKILIGFNDLKTEAPPFLSEWDYGKNGSLKPVDFTKGSNKKVWWKHFVTTNGKEILHSWQATIKSRMRGNGCPICDNKMIVPGINDIASTHPILMKDWDYERNEIKPTSISYGYDKKVWWKHTVIRADIEYIHVWQASPNSRTNRNSGCPYCANKKTLAGFNDLATIHPKIATKWDYEKNKPLTPYDFTAASGKKVWWIDRKKPISISDRVKYIRKS